MLTTTYSKASALNHGFDGFIAFLQDQDTSIPTLSPKRFSDLLSIDIQSLADQAHVHRNTISRAPESESVQKYLREALRVLRAACDISGEMKTAIFWYRNAPLPPFHYKTAEQLVSEGRTEDVLRYVQSFEAGATG